MFLHLCREDYVGTDDGTLISKMVHWICKRFAKLRMEYRSKTGNRLVIDTPDELYENFIGVVAGLTDDATG